MGISQSVFRIGHYLSCPDGFNADGLDHQRSIRNDETKLLTMSLFKGGEHVSLTAGIHLQRGIRRLIPQQSTNAHFKLILSDPLLKNFCAGLFDQRGSGQINLLGGILSKRFLDLNFAHGTNIGQPHAISRQNSGERMQEDPLHPQCVGDKAGVLATCATETVESVFRHVVTALNRDLLNGVRHIVDRDPQKAFGHLFRSRFRCAGGLGDFLRQLSELFTNNSGVQRLIRIGAKNLRKVLRLDFPEHDVAIGDSQRPATQITGRTGIGSS